MKLEKRFILAKYKYVLHEVTLPIVPIAFRLERHKIQMPVEIKGDAVLVKQSSPEMSARIGYQLEDISRYNLDLDGLREQKKASEDIIGHLKKERELISLQIDELRMKLNTLDTRIGKEEEICSRLERTIAHANETYEKLVESSQSLVDYVKKEYEGARSSGSSFT
uniref:Chromosome segregation protein SMC n=1 Tax=Loa loa TaxID=7209 RepID=A0A1I7VSK8_LOALO